MFRRQVRSLSEVLHQLLREEGLETPLNEKRLVDVWDEVVGPTVVKYTAEKFVKNHTLFVKIQNPALRQDLSMMRSQLVRRLNAAVGGGVITEVRIY